MANPITWRTINSRSNEGAANIMDSAGDSINQGFAGFDKILQGAQKVREDNRDTRIDNNTQGFLDRIQGIKDPEKLAQLQASGELQQQLEGYGAMVDRDRTQGAVDTRLTGLREMQTTNREYADSETRYGNREARDAHDVAIAEGRFDDALKIREETDFLDQGQMAQQQTKAEQAAAERDWVAEKRDNSRADRARAKQEREAKKANQELLSTTHADITAPLADGETYTMRKNQLNDLMKSDQFKFMAPSERTAFKQTAQESLQFGEAIAEGDQAKVDEYLKPVERERNRNVFYKHQTREVDDGTLTKNIVDSYASEDADTGLSTFLNEPNGNKRMAIQQSIQSAINGLTPNGEVILEGGIPESYVRRALEGVKGNDWKNWDNDFQDQLEKITSSEAFLNDYERYVDVDEKYDTMKSQAHAAARNGNVPSTSAPQSPKQSGSPQRPDIPTPTPDTRSVTAPNTPGLNPRGPAVAPVLPNGDVPQEQSNGSPLPRPDLSPINEKPSSESGADKIMRRFGNLGSYVTNSIKEQQYETQQNTFEEMTSLMGNNGGDVGPNEKQRLTELVRTNPSMLKFMTTQQRNNMRNILGEGMINQILKQTE